VCPDPRHQFEFRLAGLLRCQDDRDLGLPPDDAAEVESVDKGQHEIEDHQLGRPFSEQAETGEAVDSGDGVEALAPELRADGSDERLLVLQYEDGPHRA
jgi:hypothetical protein